MEDDIQDAAPEPLPVRLEVPFTYKEPRPRPPRGAVIALVLGADVLLAILGGFLMLLIDFQSFAETSPALSSKQASQTELLGGVVTAVLVLIAACTVWARTYLTGLLQCVFIVAVLIFTASAVHHYERLFPSSGTPTVQSTPTPTPTSTYTYVPCFSGSNDCPGG
ncbi:hypothetical protein KDK95_00900 [Actinospica sp. MGRD01-02]|uniref:Uncharacterized protein n=1 Tax=Actinospica acidithermotolerans TaxID=2828514 RepID=A0A941IGN6_9ACTN|nr:hypothetical protein [Actinospica acidithermotolerans]MBR7824847.1 hypothetical protein [Actinospica acidithermotolerans]